MAKTTTIKDLKLDPKNANKHSTLGTGLLENSLRENGAGRSIVISNDNVVIAGNGTVEGANAIGVEKMRIIETDGSEIIAVKRKDIESGTAAFYKLALADNVVAQKNIVLDAEVVQAIVQEYPATKVWGSIITDPPGAKEKADEKVGQVTKSFTLSASQAAKVTTAIKTATQLNKAKFQNAGGPTDNGNALYFIVMEYLKNHKK